MKKLFVIALFFTLVPLAHAATPTATDNCNTGDPQFACSGTDVCIGSPIPTCQTNNAPQTSGTCTVNAGCVNYGTGWTCQNGTCVAPSSASSQTTGFVPLAPIPGLTQGVTASQSGIATFLNNLYKYLIGIAAVLAVIMIIWGGIEIMGESVTKKSDGKAKIQQAILGLVLVLSPVLVFSIINPAILNLSLNIPALSIENQSSGDSTPVAGSTGPSAGTTNGSGQFTSNQTLYPCASGGNCSAAETQCQNLYAGQGGGYTVNSQPSCITSGRQVDPNGATSQNTYLFGVISGQITACKQGEQLEVVCSISGSGSGSGAYIGH